MCCHDRTICVKHALYDSARRASQSAWVWRHSDLSDRVLDTFYYGVVAPRFGLEPELQATFATVDDEWCCWYRLFDGGRDSLGRPGRFLVAAALMLRSNVTEVDTTGVLELPFFQEVALAARKPSPTTSPSETEQMYKVGSITVDAQTLGQLQRSTLVEFHDQNGLRAAVVACSCLTPPARWRLDIRSEANCNQVGGEASVTVLLKKPDHLLTAAKNTTAVGGLSSVEPLQQMPSRNIRLLGAIALLAVAIGAVCSIYWFRVLRSSPGETVKPHGRIDARAVNSQPHLLNQPFGRERDEDSAQPPGRVENSGKPVTLARAGKPTAWIHGLWLDANAASPTPRSASGRPRASPRASITYLAD